MDFDLSRYKVLDDSSGMLVFKDFHGTVKPDLLKLGAHIILQTSILTVFQHNLGRYAFFTVEDKAILIDRVKSIHISIDEKLTCILYKYPREQRELDERLIDYLKDVVTIEIYWSFDAKN